MKEFKTKEIGRFECCGTTYVTVIIEGKAACTMTEKEAKFIYGRNHLNKWGNNKRMRKLERKTRKFQSKKRNKVDTEKSA